MNVKFGQKESFGDGGVDAESKKQRASRQVSEIDQITFIIDERCRDVVF
jgi:hypothetical protein